MLIVVAVVTIALCAWAGMKLSTPYLVAVLVVVAPLPFYVGIVGLWPDGDSIYASFQVIELSGTAPTSEELADGGAVGLAAIFSGLLLSLPNYVLAVGLLAYRAFRSGKLD